MKNEKQNDDESTDLHHQIFILLVTLKKLKHKILKFEFAIPFGSASEIEITHF